MPKATKLKVEVQVTWADGSTKTLQALVDTGAELNLINPKLLDPSLFSLSPKPIRLGMANSNILLGGTRQVTMNLTFAGVDMDTGHIQEVTMPVTAYDGEVVVDLILSYGWLAEQDILINPRRHGMHFMGGDQALWVAGILPPKIRSTSTLQEIPLVTSQQGKTPAGALSPAPPRMGNCRSCMC